MENKTPDQFERADIILSTIFLTILALFVVPLISLGLFYWIKSLVEGFVK
jgi:hypothetical protein